MASPINEFINTELPNSNPCAIFGSKPYVVGAERDKEAVKVFVIENIAEGSSVARLEHNTETGVVTSFDKKGNAILQKKLKEGERAWPTIDRFAEKYYHLSPYSYAAGNPANIIDINGDSLWFSYQYNRRGELSGVTLHFQGKVINQSGSKVNMERATSSIASQLQSTYSGTLDNGVAFNVAVDLTVANSMADVNDSDHLIALVDGINTPWGDANGAANQPGGKVAFVDAGYFTGPWDISIGNTGRRTAVHEIGHLMLGAGHHKDPSNIMAQNVGSRWYVNATNATNNQRVDIHSNFNNGYLNQGSNYEIARVPSPSSPTGYVDVKYPNRGLFRANINF